MNYLNHFISKNEIKYNFYGIRKSVFFDTKIIMNVFSSISIKLDVTTIFIYSEFSY